MRYLITDNNPIASVSVHGTSNMTPPGSVDIRCYNQPGEWQSAAFDVPVAADGSFTSTMKTNDAYGTCKLRAVPAGLAASSDVSNYTGPKVTTEWRTSQKIESGPNAGKVYNYYVEWVNAYAMNDYGSATSSGLWDSRLQYPDGSGSAYLWYRNAALTAYDGTRSRLKVDGRNAYGPGSAQGIFPDSEDNSGFPQLTFSATRNVAADTTTIHESNPIVRCPNETPFPPTAASCPQFRSTGVRLDRTIFTNDGGRQVHISDVWRSTDGKAHTISAHYDQTVEGQDRSTGGATETSVGMKLPWRSNAFVGFFNPTTYPGPARVPATIFIRDNLVAPDGDATFPRGAITFDFAPSAIRRDVNNKFTMRDDNIKVPAGGSRLVRQDFVISRTQSTVNAKAAASRARINPYRPDGLIRKAGTTSFVGNRVYNVTGAQQTLATSRHRGGTATFFLKVINHGTAPDGFKVQGPGDQPGMTARYLAGATGSTNITTAVKNGTYTLSNVLPGKARTMRLIVTVKAGASIGALRSWLVRATSTHDANRKDAVKANVRVI